VLRPLNTRGIEYFHAGRCFGRYDEFDVLGESEKSALFEELISLIKRTARVGLVCGLSEESFTTAIRRNKLRRFSGSMYTACVLRSLDLIQSWADEENFDGKIVYVFEAGHEFEGEADAMLTQIVDVPEHRERLRYGGHQFAPKLEHPPLQAADLFLWLWQKGQREGKKHPYFRDLVHLRHAQMPVTHLCLSVLAIGNMNRGIESTRNGRGYEIQTGAVKTYSF
jgi:hypothetical protein